ncbi:MAG: site-specific integrase [Proteobacteria bacterium]|nr:site-specific integrase [Pseudomonadota bacterium]
MKQAKTLNQKQLFLFLKQLELFKNSQRNQLIISLTFYGGLRIGEVTKLKWKDVIDNNLTVKDEIILSAENNKSNEVQRLFLNKKLRLEIVKYKTFFSQKYKHINLESPLIISQRNTQFSPNSLCQLINSLYKRCNLPTATTHSGRRSFITNLANKSLNAKVIMSLARHKNLSTTQRYIDVNDEQLKQAIELI